MTTVRELRPDDRNRWRRLFSDYRDFYRLEADDAVVDRVWAWLHDPDHGLEGLVAEAAGEVVGIAHHRPVSDPSSGTVGIWLDDLFTDPAARGHGVGRALLARLEAIAGDRDRSGTSWLTSLDNATARRLYDAVATRTDWVVYEATPAEPPERDGLEVRAVEAEDRDRWRELYAGYRAFYRLAADDDVVARAWTWLLNPGHEVAGLVAVLDDRVVGLAHHRRFARPSTGTTGLWLDDLFTDPAARGRGVGRALLSELRGIAQQQGLSVMRWVTAADNATAQRLYGGVAQRSRWVVYEQTASTS